MEAQWTVGVYVLHLWEGSLYATETSSPLLTLKGLCWLKECVKSVSLICKVISSMYLPKGKILSCSTGDFAKGIDAGPLARSRQ